MTYKYLASAYTDPDPEVMQRRFEEAEHCTHWCLQRKIWVFSPIVHCHAIAKKNDLPKDHEFWMEYDRTMILGSNGVLVLTTKDGAYMHSKGVQDEILFARKHDMSVQSIRSIDWDDDYCISVMWNPL